MRSSGKCSFQHSKTSLAEFNGELSDFPTVLSIGVVQKPPASVHVVLNSDCVWFYGDSPQPQLSFMIGICTSLLWLLP